MLQLSTAWQRWLHQVGDDSQTAYTTKWPSGAVQLNFSFRVSDVPGNRLRIRSFGYNELMLFDSQEILLKARDGDEKAKGELLERFRPYLNVIAQRHLDERLQGRLDFTDVVQTTFLEASRDFAAFRGESVDSLLAWLRNILRNNIHTAHQQHLATQKRSARLETRISIASESGGSSLGMEHIIPSDTSTPSQRMMKNEAAADLALCLERIPETQRHAIRLRYLEGCSLREISEKMGKSEMAVAGLLKRGLRTLREGMDQSSTS